MRRFIYRFLLVVCICPILMYFPQVANAQSTVIRNLKSGFWKGAVKANAQGQASYCYLLGQKSNEEFNIQLYWNRKGFHVLIYSKNWSLIEGEEFQGRVKIDRKFNELVDASVFDSESIDYLFGHNNKAIDAFQSGSRITMEGPAGERTFQLNGTRKAIDVLVDCADEYLAPDEEPDMAQEESVAPDYDVGMKAYKAEDYQAALNEFIPLAEQGHAMAQNRMGIMYVRGEGVAVDDLTALIWFHKAAAQLLAAAQANTGVMYENAMGTEKNDIEAEYWYRKASKQGNARAQNNLGVMYRDGTVVKQSKAEAIRLFGLAAKQGHEKAQKNLQDMLAGGGVVSPEKTEQTETAVVVPNGENSKKPTFAGELVTRALNILAGVEGGSLEDAYALVSDAANLGDRRGQWMAGRMALAGVGAAADRTTGLARILAAAEAGHPEALTYMGLQYLQDGEDATDETGMAYLERAADQDHAAAISALLFFEQEVN